MHRKLLVHTLRDNVGVAVARIEAGDEVMGIVMEDQSEVAVTARSSISFGHKLALASIPEGAEVIRYGSCIGVARGTKRLRVRHVHTHNVKSARCASGE